MPAAHRRTSSIVVVLAAVAAVSACSSGADGAGAPAPPASRSAGPSASASRAPTPGPDATLADLERALPTRSQVDGATSLENRCRPHEPSEACRQGPYPYVGLAFNVDRSISRTVDDRSRKGYWLPEQVDLTVTRYPDPAKAARRLDELRRKDRRSFHGRLSGRPSKQGDDVSFGYAGRGTVADAAVPGTDGYSLDLDVVYTDPAGHRSLPQQQGTLVVVWDRYQLNTTVRLWTRDHPRHTALEQARRLTEEYLARLSS